MSLENLPGATRTGRAYQPKPPKMAPPVENDGTNPPQQQQQNMQNQQPQLVRYEPKIDLPPWTGNTGTQVEGWLEAVDLIFDTHDCDEKARFRALLSRIPIEIQQSLDPAFKTKATFKEKYDSFKDAVKSRFAASDTSRINELLSQCTLGNKRPSHLLQEMRNKAKEHATDSMLESLWAQRLPDKARRAVAAAISAGLDEKAKIADAVVESDNMSTRATVAAIDGSGTSNDSPRHTSHGPTAQADNALFAELKRLREEIADLRLSKKQNNNSNHGSSGGRGRSRSRSRGRVNIKDGNTNNNNNSGDSQSYKNKEFCWYHRTFGDKAERCIPDNCKWSSGN